MITRDGAQLLTPSACVSPANVMIRSPLRSPVQTLARHLATAGRQRTSDKGMILEYEARRVPSAVDHAPTHLNTDRHERSRVKGSSPRKSEITGTLVLLFLSQPQLVLQLRQDLTRTMMIKPRRLVASQPARAAAPLHRPMVDVEVLLDRTSDHLPQLWTCQRRGLYFSPAASPDSGTTRQEGPGFDDDAKLASSSPGSPPSPLLPWHVGDILRSDARPWPRGQIPPAAPPNQHLKDSSHA